MEMVPFSCTIVCNKFICWCNRLSLSYQCLFQIMKFARLTGVNERINIKRGSGALFQLVDLKIAAVDEFACYPLQVIEVKRFGNKLNAPLLSKELVRYAIGSTE